MGVLDILVLSGLILAVIGAVIWICRGKKQGKSGCGNCPYAASCADGANCADRACCADATK